MRRLFNAQISLIQKGFVPRNDVCDDLAADADAVILRRNSRAAVDADRPRSVEAESRNVKIDGSCVADDSAVEKVREHAARAFGNVRESGVAVIRHVAWERKRVAVRGEKHRTGSVRDANDRLVDELIRESVQDGGVDDVDVRVHGRFSRE